MKFNILHVGDIHICKKDFFDEDVVLKAFMKDIEQISKTSLKPDLIICTGDLVQSADIASDFDLAWDNFIIPLSEATNCNYERIFFTAGNHDVQRSVVERKRHLVSGLDASVNDRESIKNEMNNSETNLYVKEKFENFNIATSDFGKKYRIQESPYSSCYHVPELNLGIVAINTSWLSTGGLVREDKGHLAVSDVVLQTGLNSFPDTLKKIIIGHHPLSDMMEFNERSITAIMQRHAAAYLHGHLHEIEPIKDSSGCGTQKLARWQDCQSRRVGFGKAAARYSCRCLFHDDRG